MDEFIELLENFWILKDNDKSEYFRIKRAVDNDMKKFAGELLGWKIIVNNRLIKLEKIPAKAHSFMGIKEFESKEDYCLFCAVLIYLDDKDDGEQFLLTELIESVEKIISDIAAVDFTKYSDRKSLVRVLKFSQEMSLIKISEGSLENAANDKEREILYENTGLSRYFSVHHDNDISENKSYRDFENSEDMGYRRINRVYRRLVMQPGMYWDSKDDADSIYLKNQRTSVSKYLEKYLDGRLDIHNGSAFYVLSTDSHFGSVHPSDRMISGLVSLICSEIRNCPEIYKNEISEEEFSAFILKCRSKYISGLSKEYREMSDEKLISSVMSYMKDWLMIKNENGQIFIYDGVFKTAGKYPDDFKGGV